MGVLSLETPPPSHQRSHLLAAVLAMGIPSSRSSTPHAYPAPSPLLLWSSFFPMVGGSATQHLYTPHSALSTDQEARTITATAAIVLAAGKGTRMRSRLPKV